MNEAKTARNEYPIHPILAERWSPYGFSDRPVSLVDLRSLFEAARWAASSYNEQPWRYVVGTRDEPELFADILSCLVPGNQAWALAAPVLAIGCAHRILAKTQQPNAAAEHDLGAASAALTWEATSRGLFVHQMIGIEPERVREVFQVPAEITPLTGLAIGYWNSTADTPEKFRERDLADRGRRPIADFVFGRRWGEPAAAIRS